MRHPYSPSSLVTVAIIVTALGCAPWIPAVYAQLLAQPREFGVVHAPEAPSFFYVFLRNLAVAVFLAAGRLTLGTTSVAGLLAVGFGLGKSIALALERHVPPLSIAAALLPHGVLELPGLWLAAAIGLTGAFPLFRTAPTPLPRAFLSSCGGIAVLLIATAAMVESTVTPMAMSLLSRE